MNERNDISRGFRSGPMGSMKGAMGSMKGAMESRKGPMGSRKGNSCVNYVFNAGIGHEQYQLFLSCLELLHTRIAHQIRNHLEIIRETHDFIHLSNRYNRSFSTRFSFIFTSTLTKFTATKF